jgi:hypothetical protein
MKKPTTHSILLLLLFSTVTFQSFSANPCDVIAKYTFSGNADDETLNKIDGTVYSATLTNDRNGIANSAYSFNGTTSYIDLGNNSLLKRYQNDFSISAWVYLNEYGSTYGSTIVSNRDQNNIGSSLVVCGQTLNNGKVGFTIQGGANSSSAYSNTVLDLHKWYFISITYNYQGNNANRTKIYVNGILETTTLLHNVIEPVTTPTYIGFDPSPLAPNDYHMNGSIDEVMISSCFLSDQQIKDSYVPPIVCGPLAKYTFSGNADDETLNKIDGTVYSATLTTDRNGIANSAYSFNGTTSYIDLGNNSLLKRYQNNFSISAWVYLNEYGSTYGSTIVSNRDQNNIGSSLVVCGQTLNNGKVGFTIQGGANSSSAYSNTVLDLHKWYFISVTYNYQGNNANPTKIYVNGILETTTLLHNVIEPVTTPTYIGFDPSPLAPNDYHMNGSIDEVMISSCFLSDQKIKDSYVPLKPVTTGVQSQSNIQQLSVYPNPSAGLFNLTYTLSNPSYEVYSFEGVIVNKGILSSQIDLTSLKKGIYILKVASDNGTDINKKLIIE